MRNEIKETAPFLLVLDHPLPGDKGRLLNGGMGEVWTKIWNSVGLTRVQFSIVTVASFQAESMQGVAQYVTPHTKIIIPCGDLALQEVLGVTGIDKYRGSIYELSIAGRMIRVIPSLPVSRVIQDAKLQARLRADWKRIAEESPRETFEPPQRSPIIYPTEDDLVYFEQQIEEAGPEGVLAIDIETDPSKKALLCVGFALSAHEAICIPWKKAREKAAVARWCAHRIPKLFANGLYDTFWLDRFDCPVANWQWDTQYMHHALNPAESHSLAFLASTLTREPYWKDDAKDEGTSGALVRGQEERLYLYNCKDAMVTRELLPILKGALERHGLMKFFLAHYQRLFQPLLKMMLGGIRIDEDTRGGMAEHFHLRLETLFAQLQETAGTDLKAKVAISQQKLAQFIYDDLELPMARVRNKKTGVWEEKRSTGELHLKKLILRDDGKMTAIGPLILDIRRTQQLATFVNPQRFVNGRFYFGFKFNTEAGRLASSANPMKEGSNLQNQDREIRHIFLPDPGHVFIEMDMSQIESRYVYMMTGDAHLRELANAKPGERDMHRENAAPIFKCSVEEVTKEQRQLGKIISHGAQRDMYGKTLSDNAFKDYGLVISPQEAGEFLEAYHRSKPGIRAWFRAVRLQLIEKRQLVNSWGRTLTFPYDRFDERTYRKAYSFFPQSECADHINQRGILFLTDFLQEHPEIDCRLMGQVHDSLLLSVHPDHACRVWRALRESLEAPVQVDGYPLVVPVDTKIGATWKGKYEVPYESSDNEFLELVKECRQGSEA